MGYYLSEPAPSKGDLTAKNRVWGFFGESVSVDLETRHAALETHRENYDESRKPASGIPLWPSRDPIGERGGVNLYGFVENDGVSQWDLLGLSSSEDETNRTCCNKPTIKKGREELDRIFAETEKKERERAARRGEPVAKTSYFENHIQSCNGRAAQVARDFNDNVPKCWECVGVNKRAQLFMGDHWWIECRAYDKEGRLADWKNYDLHAVMHGEGNRQDQAQNFPVTLPIPEHERLEPRSGETCGG